MSKYVGDFLKGRKVTLRWNSQLGDGTPAAPTGTFTPCVYEHAQAETGTGTASIESTTGITYQNSFDGRAGLNYIVVDTSADATFYDRGKDFDIILCACTIGGVTQSGKVLGSFSIENRIPTAIPSESEYVRLYADPTAANRKVRRVVKKRFGGFARTADWSPAAGDVKVDLGAGPGLVNITSLPTSVVGSGGMVYWVFIFTQAELTAPYIMVMISDANGVVEDSFVIMTYGNVSAGLPSGPVDANLTQALGTGVTEPNIGDLAAGITAVHTHMLEPDTDMPGRKRFNLPAMARVPEPYINGVPAIDVIGQPNFTSDSATPVNASTMTSADCLAIDSVNNRLWACEAANNRVLGFAIVNGVAAKVASWIIGQPNATSNTANNGGIGASTLNTPRGVAVDEIHNHLWIADSGNNRLLRYDMTSGPLAFSQAAVGVLGQINFTANGTGLSQSTLNNPMGVSYDPTNDRVLGADYTNNRIMVFNSASTVTTGTHNAAALIGQTIYSQKGTGSISGATNASPILITTGLAHGLITGQHVSITGALGNTAANGTWIVTVTGNFTFTLNGSVGNGVWTSGGTWNQAVDRNTLNGPVSVLWVDSETLVFVGEGIPDRVSVWDGSALVGGMLATSVLGANDFISAGAGSVMTQNRLNFPNSIGFDPKRRWLFVPEESNGGLGFRTSIWEIDNLVSGTVMQYASYVIGQNDFSSSRRVINDYSGMEHMSAVCHVAYDKLYIGQVNIGGRILVYELHQSPWDVNLSKHIGTGSTGAALNAVAAPTDPWSIAIPGAYGAGTAGHRLGNIPDIAPGNANAILVAGSNAATSVNLTSNITGNLSGTVGGVNGNVTGSVGSVTGNIGGSVNSVVTAITLPTIPNNWITAAGIAAGALNGKGDWPSASTVAGAVWDVVLASHLTSGSTGSALNAAGSAGDPWATTLPGAYGAGTAGNLIGNRIDAAITSRMATYAQPTGFLTTAFPSGTVASTTNLTGGTIANVTNAVVLPSIPNNWITAAGINAAALNGKGDWLLSASYTPPDNADIVTAVNAITNGTYGLSALHTQIGTPMQAGNVTVGAYASGQDPATLLLVTPTNKIATDSSNRVTALLSVGTGAGQVNVASGKVPATLAAGDVTGNIATDVQTIKSQTLTCAAPVTISPFVGNATAAISVDANGRLDVIKVNGTFQTGRDLGAGVLVTPGTSAGQLDVSAGRIHVNIDNTAAAQFFSVNSGTNYGASVAGSVVKEIVTNAGGGGGGASAATIWSDPITNSEFTGGGPGAVLLLMRDILEADQYIDTTTTPWQLVYIKRGTGVPETGTAHQLMRKNLKSVTGANINTTSTVPGRVYE